MTAPRVRSGTTRETGLLPQIIARAAGRRYRTRPPALFLVLGRHRPLFRAWLHFSARLLRGAVLSRREVELVILRVAMLRDCAYELDHHLRLGRRAGLGDRELAGLRTGSTATGWSERERALLAAVEELHRDRDISDPAWAELRTHFTERAAIEICLLAGHYELLATTITALRIPVDEPLPRSGAQDRRLPGTEY